MNRHEQRKRIFQLIFQLDAEDYEFESSKHFDVYESYDYVKLIVDAFIKNRKQIDEDISKYLNKFTLDRLSKVERSILRTAFSEVMVGETPNKVIVNEAVMISKDYGDTDSYKFINGVLRNFLKDS